MTTHPTEASARFEGRVAGAFYVLVFLAGGAAAIASGGLFTLIDAAATATNILLHETRFWLGFTLNLIVIRHARPLSYGPPGIAPDRRLSTPRTARRCPNGN
jgi:hypothetical protein